jgi:hypothetical protein
VTAQPTRPTTEDRAASNPATLIPTPTPTPTPATGQATAGHVTARDISKLLRHLADLRVGAPGNDPAVRAAFMTRKASLLARIADPHIQRGTDPTSTAPEGRTP